MGHPKKKKKKKKRKEKKEERKKERKKERYAWRIDRIVVQDHIRQEFCEMTFCFFGKLKNDWHEFDPGPASQNARHKMKSLVGHAVRSRQMVVLQPYPTKREKLCDPK